MKLILAVIRPTRLDDVKEALRGVGIRGLTSVEAQGFAVDGSHTEMYRGADYQVDFVPRIQLEVLVEDAEVQPIVDAIVTAARTGKPGDGKVVVVPVEHIHRIRTGETGSLAL